MPAVASSTQYCTRHPSLYSNIKNRKRYIKITDEKLSLFIDNIIAYKANSNLRDQSIQFSSVAQSCPTLCNTMNCSTPGLPVHHQFPEFTQTHVHQVGDAIQHLILCCPLHSIRSSPLNIILISTV